MTNSNEENKEKSINKDRDALIALGLSDAKRYRGSHGALVPPKKKVDNE